MGLVDDLADGIESWQREKESRSIAMLSKHARVSESTLWRIVKRNAPDDISLEIVLNIVNTVFSRSEGHKLLSTYFPQLASWIDISSAPGTPSKVEWNEFFESREHLLIILLCDRKSGTDRAQVKEVAGIYGLDRLEELLKAGIIKEEGGRYYENGETFNVGNQSTLTMMIKHFCSFYREENSLMSRTAVKTMVYRAFNGLGVEEAYDLARKFEMGLRALALDPKYHGDIPFFSGLVQNIVNGGQKCE
jgi:hypothetical protein